MKKRRGVITITFIFFVVLIISFFLAVFDFTRVINAKTLVSKHTENSMDVALANYDENLFKKYGIMAVPSAINPEDMVRSALEYSLGSESGSWNTTSYKLENLNVKTELNLENTDAVKLAILKKHKKKFIANTLISWIEKLDILKNMKTYSKIASIYSKTIRKIAELKSKFDKVMEFRNKISNMAKSIKDSDISNTVNSIISSREKIESLKEKYDQINELITNKEIAFLYEYQSETGTPKNNEADKEDKNNTEEKNKSDKEELEKLKEESKEIKEEISELEEALKPLEETLGKLKDTLNTVDDFASKVNDFSNKVNSTVGEIKVEIDSISSSKEAKKIVETTKNFFNTVEKTSKKISDISEDLAKRAGDAKDILDKIEDSLNKGKSMAKTSFNFDFPNFTEDIDIASLFGKDILSNGKDSLFSLLDNIWKVFSGEFIPDFSGLANIDSSEYSTLPSVKKESETLKQHEAGEKPSDETELAKENMKSMEESSDKISQRDLLTLKDNVVDKLIIADYAINTFSHYDYKSPKKSDLLGGAEVEYLLSGNSNSSINLSITYFKIFMVRMVFNTISILTHENETIGSITATLSSGTLFLGYPLIYGVVSLSWVSVETLTDMREIINGKSVVLLKGKEDINTSISSAGIKSLFDTLPAAKSIKGEKITMEYKDFLVLFLILEKEEETLIRISDLIKLKEKIEPEEYFTSISLFAEFNIPRIFPNVNSVFTNAGSKKGKNFNITKVRGY